VRCLWPALKSFHRACVNVNSAPMFSCIRAASRLRSLITLPIRFSSHASIVEEQRAAQFGRSFLAGIPKIWCQPIVHLKSDGTLDTDRIKEHIRFMFPMVRNFYVPRACDPDCVDGRDYYAELVRWTSLEPDMNVFAGAPASDLETTCDMIQDTMQWMLSRMSGNMPSEFALKAHTVAGFAVSLPVGEQMSDETVVEAFGDVFAMDLPIAIIQRPPPVLNSLTYSAFERMAAEYSNFLALLDFSGSDDIACRIHELNKEQRPTDVKLFRAVECDYDVWLNPVGPYSSVVLHSANCFGPQLTTMLQLLEDNDLKGANEISQRICKVLKRCSAVTYF